MKLAYAALITLVVTRGVAHAEPSAGELKPSFFYDGGAIPFFWVPALSAIAIDRWVQPRKTPLYFDADDGGARRATWENPGWTIYIGAVGLAGGIIRSGDESRWYHVKGLAQALATSSLVVSALKPAFGRHRPDWAADDNDVGDLKSFPSGHTTGAFVVATYAALYLNSRVFDNETSGLVQGAAYGGIFLGASLFASERIYHARHHLTDVMVGAVIGSASSYAMFRFQDHRFRNRDAKDSESGGSGGGGWQITPSFSQESVTLGLSGDF